MLAVSQYAASYSPSYVSSPAAYVAPAITKQVSYATNPLFVSGYKSGYVAPAVATTLSGGGIYKSAGYHAAGYDGYG